MTSPNEGTRAAQSLRVGACGTDSGISQDARLSSKWTSLADCKQPAFDPQPRGVIRAILPTIPERVVTDIFVITIRKKAFTVLGLIFIRLAISLLVRPKVSNSTVSCSRCVRPNCWAAAETSTEAARSSRMPRAACAAFPEQCASVKNRQVYRLLPDLKSAADTWALEDF